MIRLHMRKAYARDEVRELIEAREKARRDYISGLSTAREEGLEQGLKKGCEEVAERMLGLGLDLELISQATGLPATEIERLKEPGEAVSCRDRSILNSSGMAEPPLEIGPKPFFPVARSWIHRIGGGRASRGRPRGKSPAQTSRQAESHHYLRLDPTKISGFRNVT